MPLQEVARVLAVPGAEAADRVAAHWDGVERRAASQRELARYVQAELTGERHSCGLPSPQVRGVRSNDQNLWMVLGGVT
jgi:hypothetical protein